MPRVQIIALRVPKQPAKDQVHVLQLGGELVLRRQAIGEIHHGEAVLHQAHAIVLVQVQPLPFFVRPVEKVVVPQHRGRGAQSGVPLVVTALAVSAEQAALQGHAPLLSPRVFARRRAFLFCFHCRTAALFCQSLTVSAARFFAALQKGKKRIYYYKILKATPHNPPSASSGKSALAELCGVALKRSADP